MVPIFFTMKATIFDTKVETTLHWIFLCYATNVRTTPHVNSYEKTLIPQFKAYVTFEIFFSWHFDEKVKIYNSKWSSIYSYIFCIFQSK